MLYSFPLFEECRLAVALGEARRECF